jgi:hypothetical protein
VRFNIKMDLMEVVAGMRTGFLWVIIWSLSWMMLHSSKFSSLCISDRYVRVEERVN